MEARWISIWTKCLDDSFRMRKAFFDIKKHSSVSWKGRAKTDWNNLKLPPKIGTSPTKASILGGASKKKSAKRNISTYNFWAIFQENGPQQNSMSIFAKNMLWSYILWWILVAKKALLEGGLLKWLIQRRHRGAQGRSRLRFLEKTTGRWGKMDS